MLDGNKGGLERTVQQLIELTVIPDAPFSESSSPQQPSSSTALAPIVTRARSKSKQSQSPISQVDQQADRMEKELKRMMIEEEETELWNRAGRPKNDGYINGSHSGYGHALRDMRQWIDRIKMASGRVRV